MVVFEPEIGVAVLLGQLLEDAPEARQGVCLFADLDHRSSFVYWKESGYQINLTEPQISKWCDRNPPTIRETTWLLKAAAHNKDMQPA